MLELSRIREKKKPEIIARFFRTARSRAEENNITIEQICDSFKCSKATVYNYEDVRRRLSYEQLRSYVEFYGIPAGVVLIITRLTSDFRDGKDEDAIKIAKGVRAVADYIIENSVELRERDYQTENGKNQDLLILELWEVYRKHGLYKPAFPETDGPDEGSNAG